MAKNKDGTQDMTSTNFDDVTLSNSDSIIESTTTSVPTVVTEQDTVILNVFKTRKIEPAYDLKHIPIVKKVGILVSRLNNPVYISYGDTSILLPPRGKEININPEKLGSLPKGIDFIER